jgi:crotonobetainyl-CoA:carnitine CoA-transferase CaiB-like acyl-CoA transferase
MGLPEGGQAVTVGPGFSADADGPDLAGAPPAHGQHTREVLLELDFPEATVDDMIAAGAAFEAPR